MSAHQTATVQVRGHSFSVDFLPENNRLPTVLRLWIGEHPDDVLRVIDDETLDHIRIECVKRQREQDAFIARCEAQERLEA